MLQPWSLLAFGAALLALGGCQTTGTATFGESSVAAELQRVRSNAGFRVVEDGPERTFVSATGRDLVLRPVEGLCLTREGIELTERGVFAVVADCLAETVPEPVEGEDASLYRLPPTFPGLITISVSGQPMFDQTVPGADALATLREFLSTEAGRAMLGRNGLGKTVEVVDTRVLSDALYVHVRDTHSGGLSLLAPDFWRAFVELNGRMVLVTVSGFRDRPLGETAMIGVLAAQVMRLRAANRLAPVAEEERLARKALARFAKDGETIAVADPSVLQSNAVARAPVPIAREESGRLRVELRPFRPEGALPDD
ncbi:MAG: hypothetical protein AAGI34_14760 [Pseudomonadota bacterium]